MKTAIPCLYSSYGRYIDEFRAIPSIYDCMKVVERRVLYTMFRTAGKKLVKSARVVGDCIGLYHPHGDLSTYETLVNLVNRGFGIGQGNFGVDGVKYSPPAAYRYTEVKLMPILHTIAFDLIKYVPYSDPEALDEVQPDFIPCCVPIGMIGSGVITGISFNATKIPRYTFPMLVNRLQNILMRQRNPNVAPYTIIPNIPNCDIEEATPGEFEKIFTTGTGKIIIKPHYKVDRSGIHVYGRPPMGCSSWIKDDTDDKKAQFACDDLSGKAGFEALFTPKNGTRYDQDFVTMIVKTIESTITFSCNIWDGNNVVLKSIDDLILISYNKWCECLKAKWNEVAANLKAGIREVDIISVIRELINDHNIKLVKLDDLLNVFTNDYKPKHPNCDFTIDEIRDVCKKRTIHKLFEFVGDKQSLLQKLGQIESKLNNFDVEAFNVVLSFVNPS